MKDYRHYPYLEETQQRYDNEAFSELEDYQAEHFLFKLPKGFIQKLTKFGAPSGASLGQLQKCYDLKANYITDNPLEFWELTPLELEILTYMLHVLNTHSVLEKLNQQYGNIFEETYLKKQFKLDEQEKMDLYYAKISEEPIPDDVICIHLPNIERSKLEQISEAIATPHAYRCICIPHKHSLEIYGVFSHIAQHLQQMKLHD